MPAECEKRLLGSAPSTSFNVGKGRGGAIVVRALESDRAKLGWFFRVALRPSEDGTEIEVSPDGPFALKALVTFWLGMVAVLGCVFATTAVLEGFGIRWGRGSGSPLAAAAVAAVMFVSGMRYFRAGRRPEDQRAVADFIRLQVDAEIASAAAELAVAADGASPRG